MQRQHHFHYYLHFGFVWDFFGYYLYKLIQNISNVNTNILKGGVFPACFKLIGYWAPPNEKGKFISALSGTGIGSILCWSLTGYLTEQFGWHTACYLPASIVGIFTIIWFIVIYDTPAKHPTITKDEKNYIEQSLHGVTYPKVYLP